MTRTEKVARFREMHQPGNPLVMPNPWDLGSAKLMVSAGAKAVATTSSGHAFTIGLPDLGYVSREDALAHAADIARTVDVPVSGDFENGYGDSPEIVAETVRLAAEAGLAGVSIEDMSYPDNQPYPLDLAVARIEAAVEAAKAVDIVLTARADGWMHRGYQADEAVRRCTAYAEGGADVIYAPLVKPETVQELAKLGPPVNVLAVGKMTALTVADIAAMGAGRISIGGALARVTHGLILNATRDILGGDLSALGAAAKAGDIDAILAGQRSD
ncbi:MAG: isocitrate lyase/phosphoenolpyruvate mutase family protein [Pseudomonadota bacterium]